MKQISTGTGLVALSIGIVATAFIATHRGSSEAFAQGTSVERRIVAAGVYDGMGDGGGGAHWGYRIWSDNVTEVKYLGMTQRGDDGTGFPTGEFFVSQSYYFGHWQAIDDGTSAILRADVDQSRQVDAGDMSAVLLDFGSSTDETPPPPIDCNINAPR